MATSVVNEPALAPAPSRGDVWRRLFRDRGAVAGAVIIAVFVLAALLAPLITKISGHNPYDYNLGALAPNTAPKGFGGGISADHWFGVEPLTGRDLFAVVIYGARTSLLVGITATVVSVVLGVLIGVVAGYFGGWTDRIISRATDVIFGFPSLIFIIALGAIVPTWFPKSFLIVLVIGFFGWPSIARVVRGQTLALKERNFVVAAQASGARAGHIIVSELLPNLTATIIVFATISIPGKIGAEAALSFLGVGVPPPTPAWGRSIGEAINWVGIDPMFLIFPGAALFLITLAFNIFGDGLRDVLDPRSREWPMRYARFLGARIVGMVIVLFVIALISYLIFYLLPANPAQLSCGRPCTPDRLAQASAFMGLDKPWWQQFFTFLGGLVTGRTFGTGANVIQCSAPCFGYSFRLSESVTQLIGERAPVTFSIAIGAAILWVILGVATGVISALRRGSLLDRSLVTLSVAGVSAPAYLVGLLGILLFGFTLNMVPVGGYVPLTQSPIDWLWHLVLPWVVLALLNAAIYTRLTRGQMLEVMNEDYIRTARAKGLRERRVVGRHALRNVLIPVATVFGLDLGSLLGGAVLTEKVFAMQGLGSLLLDAVGNLDLQVLVGVTLFAAFLIIFANFLVDLSYGLLDPRVKTAAR